MKENKIKLIEHLELSGKTESWDSLAIRFDIKSGEAARKIWLSYRKKNNLEFKRAVITKLEDTDLYKDFLKWRYQNMSQTKSLDLEPYLNGDTNNVLIIGDLHLPFELEEYILFVRYQQEKYNCGTIIFIGDIVDSHNSSFHVSDPDGLSAKSELDLAILKLKEWYRLFPEATITLGNHDRIAMRKAFDGGLSTKWMKGYAEVLEVPNWNFVDEIEINGVLYIHGEGQTAISEVSKKFSSVVQGHRHTDCYTQYLQNSRGTFFGMQVGCGISKDKYAFKYAKNNLDPVISCGIVLNSGTVGFVVPFSKDIWKIQS
jgi:metallophosphoesterase superfamily enzyme